MPALHRARVAAMTLVVEAQHVFHDVQEHRVIDGGVNMFMRTHCGHYLKESVLTLQPVEGVPTCLACVVGRVRWEGIVQNLVDATDLALDAADKMLRGVNNDSMILEARPLLR